MEMSPGIDYTDLRERMRVLIVEPADCSVENLEFLARIRERYPTQYLLIAYDIIRKVLPPKYLVKP